MRSKAIHLTPTIDPALCLGFERCGACAAICPTGALAGFDLDLAAGAECSLCGLCEESCPAGAVSVPFTIVWDE